MTRLSLKFLLTAFVLLGGALQGCATMADTRTVNGTVAYRERMALPPGASVEVKLLDVSLADAPARTLAQTTVTPQGQVPVPYQLKYSASDIVPRHSYALQARITAEGRLLFITTTRHAFLGDGSDKTDIMVERVAQSPASPAGRWLAEDIRGGGVIDRLQTVLEIAADGAVSGTGGCNRMSGKAAIAGENITFGSIAATSMACVPAAMNQEAKFFATLRDVRKWRADPVRQKLALLDEGENTLMVLARQ